MVDLGGPLGQPVGLGPDRLGLPGDLRGPLQRLRYAVLPGALVQLRQLRPERGEPGGEIVGTQPGCAYGVQGVARGEQCLPGALDGGRQQGELDRKSVV